MGHSTETPNVTVRGPDPEPAVVVVGGIHGDEPSGVAAIHRVLGDGLDLDRTVAFVEANPAALAADRRYLDVDLNRVFPGDPDSGDHERRLAADLCSLVGDRPALSLHSTHSQPEPMALVSRDHPRAQEIAARLPTPSVVDETAAVDGALSECGSVVTVEAGCQHTEAATATAERFVRAFLQVTGALPGEPPAADPTFYTLDAPVEKPDDAPERVACSRLFELRAENFGQVDRGEVWAEVDGEELVADDPFVPILMSECGYQDIFGYRGRVVGETLAEARRAWSAPG
jgi:predicted deacylase